jgi:hypothetical protein
MNAIAAVIGFINLISGSQLRWALTGGVAFFLGKYLGEQYRFFHRELDLILFSFVLSGIAVMLSIYFQRFVAVLAGFLIGAYIVQILPEELGWNIAWINWQVTVLAGSASALAVFSLDTWGKVILSTIGGSTAVIQNLNFGGIDNLSMFIVLFAIGFTAQFLLWQYGKVEQE